MPDKVVHFELPTEDLDRAQKFYADTFGWGMNPVPEIRYVMVKTVETDGKGMPQEAGAINGGMQMRGGPVKHPNVVIKVADIDKAFEKIEAAGGKKIQGKDPVGDMGWAAYFEDTEGNVLGLWQDAE